MKRFETFKRFIIWIIIIFICFLLQTTVFQAIALAGVVPNLLLIIIVSVAYIRGQTEAMIVAIVCGLLTDCMYSDMIGLNTLFYIILAYLNGYTNRFYYSEDYTVPIILVGISDFVYNLLYYTIQFLLRNRLHFFFYIRTIMLPEIVYTVLCSILMYKLIHSLNGILDKYFKKEE